MDALPQCVWVARADLTFYYWNQRAVDYIGVQPTVAVPIERLFEFVHPDDLPTLKVEWELSTANHHTAEVQVRLRRHADGGYRWFLMRGVPQLDESESLAGGFLGATPSDRKIKASAEP